MPMPAKKHSFSNIIASLSAALKSAPEDKLADLRDSLDLDNVSDQWNASDHGNRPRVDVGNQQSASGGGASRMVSEYSPDSGGGDGLTRAYAELAEEVVSQGKRLGANEKAISSVADLLAAWMKGGSFPASESDEDEKKDDEDESEIDKSLRIETATIPSLMASLMGASRATGRMGLSTPPNLAPIAKADKLAGMMDELTPSEQNDLISLRQLRNHIDAGRVAPGVFEMRASRCTDRVRSLFGL